MSFGNQQNNGKDNSTNTNTRGYQFSNKNGFDPSAFTFGYWNEMISFRLNPALEPSKQSETKIFDYDKTVATSLTLEKAMALIIKIKNDVLPAIKEGTDKSTGIQVGGDTLIVIGTGKKFTTEPRQYLAIHKSINPDTRLPEMSIYYEFKTVDTIDDYDEKKGQYTIDKGITSEFELFLSMMKSAIIGLSNANTHASRNVNRWHTDKTDSTLSSIAEKVGAQSGFGGGNRGGFQRRTNVAWNSGSSDTGENSDNAEVSELSNIEDINNFLN